MLPPTIPFLFLMMLVIDIRSSPTHLRRLIDPAVRFRSPTVTTSSSFSDVNATHYLLEFGYLSSSNNDITSAIRQFQLFAQLPVTGQLDAWTKSKMQQKRCGNRDIGDDDEQRHNTVLGRRRRKKRYAIEGSYWGVKDITYRITKYTSEMHRQDVQKVIRRAFKVWEEQSALRFVERDDGNVNIEILFARKAHGDGEPFDGRGQILAHAFFPRYGGDVHLDDDEPWRSLQSKGIDLYSVVAHEIGHSLGLKHSQNHYALMAPFYQGYTGDAIHLHDDDVKALNHLYGKPRGPANKNDDYKTSFLSGKSDRSGKDAGIFGNDNDDDKRSLISNNRKPAPDICADASLDTITMLGNGTTYAFKGEYYWRLNQIAVDSGYPRRIADDWPALPADLDAAITDYDGDTYFFKDTKYWLYDRNGKLYIGYPKAIAVGLVDTPANIDAALIWSYDNKPYFFKDDKFWQYSRWGMPKSWPRPLAELFRNSGSVVTNAPKRIDAALKWTNGKSYLFVGRQYYRLTNWRTMKVVAGFPRDTAEWWFGCKKNGRHRRSSMDK